MRKWKLISACCLSAVLAFSGPAATAWAGSPEFARTPEEWAKLRDNVMEYDELAGLIREYNVTVQKNQLTINDKKKDDKVTRDEYAQAYRDAAFDARSNITGDDAVADAQAQVTAAQADETADKMTEDLTVDQLTFDQQEANLVASAQSSMISYFQQKLELESAKDSLEYMEAQYQSALVKQGAGMATLSDVLGAKESVQSTQATVEKLSGSLEETRQKLLVMLGWKYNDTPEIKDIPAVNFDHIASMNPETDKDAALENNYTFKINKRKLSNAVAEITKETLKRTVSSNEENIKSEVVKNYQSVQQAKAAYDQAAAEFELESKNMETAEHKQQVGTLSRLDYMKQKNAFNTKNVSLKKAQLALFQAVQTYDNAIKGLASAGG
ncbi:TolC family protein [Lacrimispora xylanolytica]|uniref:TolC family protein n=1 Tax=Lacrimispora xylanolytica TaxID=29375 RepID=A0ABY7AB38_9FIRM|nr:TolC family protein [Lacrimispora xylanolytica]WAJ23498.1 TolC family protein [Lacrimispora xylanolytica]